MWRGHNHFNHPPPPPPHLCCLKFTSRSFCVHSSFSSSCICRVYPFDLLVKQMDFSLSRIQARIHTKVWHLAPLWASLCGSSTVHFFISKTVIIQSICFAAAASALLRLALSRARISCLAEVSPGSVLNGTREARPDTHTYMPARNLTLQSPSHILGRKKALKLHDKHTLVQPWLQAALLGYPFRPVGKEKLLTSGCCRCLAP